MRVFVRAVLSRNGKRGIRSTKQDKSVSDEKNSLRREELRDNVRTNKSDPIDWSITRTHQGFLAAVSHDSIGCDRIAKETTIQ